MPFAPQKTEAMNFPADLTAFGFIGAGGDSAYFNCLTAVLSLGYSSEPKFRLWSQTGAKNLVGCAENGSNFARTFPP